MKRSIRWRIAFALGLVFSAAAARAELAPWDQAKVTALAQQLVPATQDLYDTFYKQPPPAVGQKEFYRLKQVTRVMKTEARELANGLEKGEGHDPTEPSYQSLMEMVDKARELGARIFATEDLKRKATGVRELLNQLGPYYDPEFETLQPVTR
jgi:hypothetical protein